MFESSVPSGEKYWRMERATLEQMLADGLSLAEIGRHFGRHESTIAYWAEKHGLRAANRDKYAAKGGLDVVPEDVVHPGLPGG
jgi:hypothetical protein